MRLVSHADVCALKLITGFGIGNTQHSYIVVDKMQRKRYQASPGRQEWITAIECVWANGTDILPFIILKGNNFVANWISHDAPNGWKFSNNSKGWTSNEHGMAWLMQCFNPCTIDKANECTWLLVCDGHDSHISAEFVRYCYEQNIAILLLLPHSSHLIQPLDIGVFNPLKAAMRSILSTIFQTGILPLQKLEWIQSYIKARQKVMTR